MKCDTKPCSNEAVDTCTVIFRDEKCYRINYFCNEHSSRAASIGWNNMNHVQVMRRSLYPNTPVASCIPPYIDPIERTMYREIKHEM